MPAYLIADVVDVRDSDLYERYKPLVAPTLATFGGEYLARSGAVTILEGAWAPSRVVVVRFASVGQAVRWWESADYEEPKRLRQLGTVTNMIVVDGVTEK